MGLALPKGRGRSAGNSGICGRSRGRRFRVGIRERHVGAREREGRPLAACVKGPRARRQAPSVCGLGVPGFNPPRVGLDKYNAAASLQRHARASRLLRGTRPPRSKVSVEEVLKILAQFAIQMLPKLIFPQPRPVPHVASGQRAHTGHVVRDLRVSVDLVWVDHLRRVEEDLRAVEVALRRSGLIIRVAGVERTGWVRPDRAVGRSGEFGLALT